MTLPTRTEWLLALLISLCFSFCVKWGFEANIATSMVKYISPSEFARVIGSYDCERAEVLHAAFKWLEHDVFDMPKIEEEV